MDMVNVENLGLKCSVRIGGPFRNSELARLAQSTALITAEPTGSGPAGVAAAGSEDTEFDDTGSEGPGSEDTGSENTGSENTGSENTGSENIGWAAEQSFGRSAVEGFGTVCQLIVVMTVTPTSWYCLSRSSSRS